MSEEEGTQLTTEERLQRIEHAITRMAQNMNLMAKSNHIVKVQTNAIVNSLSDVIVEKFEDISEESMIERVDSHIDNILEAQKEEMERALSEQEEQLPTDPNLEKINV